MLWQKSKTISDIKLDIPLGELKKRARIVVIDDDENAFPTARLKGEGYAIDYEPRVEKLEPLERGDYDIVILDIGGIATQWSGGDGIAILQHLKRVNPAQVVVAFSGLTFDIGKSEFWKLADDTLSKPVDAIRCKQCIDALLPRTMTPEHYWSGIVSLLRAQEVGEGDIKRLEGEVVRALIRRDTPNVRSLVDRICRNGDAVVRVLSLVTKIAGLFVH